MAKVYFNPEKFATIIADIEDLASDSATVRRQIDGEFDAEGDPMDPSYHLSALDRTIENLNNRAAELTECKDAIVNANNSGMGSMDADGCITMEISDEVTIYSAMELQSWAQGAMDAADLYKFRNTEADRIDNCDRSYDEIIASIKANSEKSAYANAFIDSYNPYWLTGYNINIDSQRTIQTMALEGEVLATASRTWSPEHSEAVAQEIVLSVDDNYKGTRDRVGGSSVGICALNVMLGGHDGDGDHINDLNFSSQFLVSMANKLEDINPGDDYSGTGILEGVSVDPMAGVLDAMGNSPYAALKYLYPDSEAENDSTAAARLEKLASRKTGEAGFAGLTAAVAAASTLRSSSDEALATRATTVSGVGIHDLAKYGELESYNEDAKARIGILVGNCPAEVVVASEKDKDAPASIKVPDSNEVFPFATSTDIKTLIYNIADSKTAVATVSGTIGAYTHAHAVDVAQATQSSGQGGELSDSDRAAIISALNTEYNRGAEATGMVAGLADARAENINKSNGMFDDDVESTASTVLGAFGTAVSGGITLLFPEAKVAGTAWNMVSTVGKPAVVDAVTPDSTYKPSAGSASLENGIYVSLIRDAANLDVLADTDFNPEKGTYSWLDNENHTINLNGTSAATTYNEMKEWIGTINSSTTWARERDPNIPEVADDLGENFSSGRTKGYEFGKNRS